jgi:hypothetical protein
MRLLPLLLTLCLTAAVAEEPLLRPSAGLLFRQPELARPGSCVIMREGGGGWILTEPGYYLRGTVVAAEVRSRRVAACPDVPGKTPAQYNREDMVRLARAYPCLAAGEPAREMQIGLVRLRVDEWETPHARSAAANGRLYRGMYLDQVLQRGLEIEVEADLLEACTP